METRIYMSRPGGSLFSIHDEPPLFGPFIMGDRITNRYEWIIPPSHPSLEMVAIDPCPFRVELGRIGGVWTVRRESVVRYSPARGIVIPVRRTDYRLRCPNAHAALFSDRVAERA